MLNSLLKSHKGIDFTGVAGEILRNVSLNSEYLSYLENIHRQLFRSCVKHVVQRTLSLIRGNLTIFKTAARERINITIIRFFLLLVKLQI